MKVILLFGPTAVGKTALLSSLFKKNFEIINADSMQVYTGLDIGTAKPDKSLLAAIPHHLIDIIDPREQFHAGEFVRLSDEIILDVISRGKVPVICGGTAFYFKNYLFGLPDIPKADPCIREVLQKELTKRGLESLYRDLVSLDPNRAEAVHPNDKYRILRSLEIIRSTGVPQSGFEPSHTQRSGITSLVLGLERERSELYSRINFRVDQMFESGFTDEIKKCIDSGLKENDPGMQGIGYKEFFLMNKNGEETLSHIIDRIKMNSRRYAKRQITFFKTIPDVKWFHPKDINLIRNEIAGFLDSAE
jgi:tRNA dimethylallyltransferase